MPILPFRSQLRRPCRFNETSPVVRFVCYEPAGMVLELGIEDLLRHTIAFGSTGAGKTTALINPAVKQLLRWKSGDALRRTGLLVLDPKADDTVERVCAYAHDAGRGQDVVILSPAGNAWYDLLGGLERPDQIEAYAGRLLAGSQDMGKENAYWTETRKGFLQTALLILLANGAPIRFTDAIEFMQGWWFSSELDLSRPKLDFLKKVIACRRLSSVSRRRLELAVSDFQNWANLDARTRELQRSCLANAIRPLLSLAARELFEPKEVSFKPEAVLDGKILVVSLDAVSYPELARLVFRVVRRDFYAAMQERPTADTTKARLCGLIADELPLSAMPEDAQALSVIRARGGFVLAASQSVSALDEVLGWRGREMLLANFNSVFFFCSRENALDQLAALTLGVDESKPSPLPGATYHDLELLEMPRAPFQRPICPPGTLSHLGPHQAFVKLANGTRTRSAVWLKPTFFETKPAVTLTRQDDLAEAVAVVRAQDRGCSAAGVQGSPFLVHMHRNKHRLHLTPDIVAAAWQVCVRSKSRAAALASARHMKVEGLADLPTCWLLGFLGWLKRQGAPQIVEAVSIRSGVLWPILTPASTWWGDAPTVVTESLNLAIYPSLWKPLHRGHRAELILERPDLREELCSIPGSLQPSR
jgi:hypothetical protein